MLILYIILGLWAALAIVTTAVATPHLGFLPALLGGILLPFTLLWYAAGNFKA